MFAYVEILDLWQVLRHYADVRQPAAVYLTIQQLRVVQSHERFGIAGKQLAVGALRLLDAEIFEGMVFVVFEVVVFKYFRQHLTPYTRAVHVQILQVSQLAEVLLTTIVHVRVG